MGNTKPPKGMFSRRHETDVEHVLARLRYQDRDRVRAKFDRDARNRKKNRLRRALQSADTESKEA